MEKQEFDRLIKEAEKNAPPMFHPVHERGKGAWFPSNEAGSIASIISHAWEDMLCLFKIRKSMETDYERRLIFKYIVIELRSVVEQIEKIQGIIFSIVRGGPKERIPHGYISKSEAEEIKSIFKKYHIAKKDTEKDLVGIRNNIGAHRGDQPWINIMEFWDKLEPETFEPLFVIIPELFEAIRNLDIYDWTRAPNEGTIEIFCSGLECL